MLIILVFPKQLKRLWQSSVTVHLQRSHLLRCSRVERGLKLHFSTCRASTVQDKDDASQVNQRETARWEMLKLLHCRSSEFVMVQGLANFPLLISQGPSLVWGTIVSVPRCWILTKSVRNVQDMPICQHASPLKLTDGISVNSLNGEWHSGEHIRPTAWYVGFVRGCYIKASVLLTGLCVRRQYSSTHQ
jgi:hypothetical protein